MMGIWAPDQRGRMRETSRVGCHVRPPNHWLCATLILICVPPAPLGAGPTGEDVRSFVRSPHIHGVPYDDARKLGPQALPELYRTLRSDADKAHWWKAVIAIGAIGEPTSFDSLHSFTWGRFKGEIDLDTFKAQTSTFYAMGSLPGNEGRRSIGYLIRGADQESWIDLPWSYGTSSEWVRQKLSRSSIAGLGLTGSVRAEEFLRSLESQSHGAGELSVIRTALKRNSEIRRVGRSQFERATREEGAYR